VLWSRGGRQMHIQWVIKMRMLATEEGSKTIAAGIKAFVPIMRGSQGSVAIKALAAGQTYEYMLSE